MGRARRGIPCGRRPFEPRPSLEGRARQEQKCRWLRGGGSGDSVRIVYFDIDTLRPDHLGCYGYHRATSPHIDALAERGVRFTDVYASDVPCLPSRTALISGMFGIRNGVANHGGVTADLRAWGAA